MSSARRLQTGTVKDLPFCAVSITWLPGRKIVAAMDGAGTVALVGRSKLLSKTLNGSASVFSQGSNRVATYHDRDLWVWSSPDLTQLDHTDFTDEIVNVTWTSGGRHLIVALSNGVIYCLDQELNEVAWLSIDSTYAAPMTWLSQNRLVTTCGDRNVALIHVSSRQEKYGRRSVELVMEDASFIGDTHDDEAISGIGALPNGRLVTCGLDGTAKIWTKRGKLLDVYECPSGQPCEALSTCLFEQREYFLVLDSGGSAHLFSPSSRTLVTSLPTGIRRRTALFAGFSADGRKIAAGSETQKKLSFWDTQTLLRDHVEITAQYRNAKIVLVGDTGVGKSGLALPLSGQPFKATISTHGRHVWTTGRQLVPLQDGRKELREVLLWDLAGQAGYRMFHRLSLRDVSVGLVLFDARNETDPFRGVNYWAKALDGTRSDTAPHSKLLVSARIDQGTLKVSNERIATILAQNRFDGFFETSAKTGEGVDRLRDAIARAIDWSEIPIVIAPEMFVQLREFLISVKEESSVLIATPNELMLEFSKRSGQVADALLFERCLQRLETSGLITRVSVGDRWLLQPELLDHYAAWLSQAARRQPDGLGAISESSAIAGDYPHQRLSKEADEALMLLISVQEVVGRELVIRVDTENGQMLVFPSELRTDLPKYPSGFDLEMSLSFGGPVPAIYAAIAVRLVNSITYGKNYRLYQSAALFYPGPSDTVVCGFAAHHLSDDDESEGELIVFFGGDISRERKLGFLRYIDYQLQQTALNDSITRQRLYSCCGMQIPPQAVAIRQQKQEKTVICPVCGRHIRMDDLALESSKADKKTIEMQNYAIVQQARQRRLTVFAAKEEVGDFDAFICYNSVDRPMVLRLYRSLRENGVVAWIDQENAAPGTQFIAEIEKALDTVPVAVIVFGPSSVGPWQEQEYYAALQRAVDKRSDKRALRIIPVLTPGCGGIEEIPVFARNWTAVDLRYSDFDQSSIMPLVQAILSSTP